MNRKLENGYFECALTDRLHGLFGIVVIEKIN